MEHYKTLRANNSYSGNALENKYRLSDITSDMVVVRDVQAEEYLLFQSRGQFWDYYDSLDQKHLEEVIFGDLPQFPKFDIDIKGKSQDDKDAVVDILRQIIDGIKDTISDEYQCTIDTVIVLEASGFTRGQWKYSFHIILPQYAFRNHLQARMFYRRLIHRLPADISKYVDDVNKSIQNFRMYGSSKLGEDRPFVLSPLSEQLGTETEIEDSNHLLVVCADTNNFLPIKKINIKGFKGSIRQPHQSKLIERAINLADERQISKGFKYRDTSNAEDVIFINFDRLCPTYCSLCNETHHKDNTLYLRLSQKDNKWAVYESCRHCKEKSNWLCHLDNEGNTVDCAKTTVQEALHKHIQDLNEDSVNLNVDSSSTFDLSNVEEYNEPSMRSYKLAETLLVRA